MRAFHFSIAAFFFFLSPFLYSQKTGVFTDPELEYKNGTELFDKKLYAAAQKSFLNVISSNKNKNSLVRIDAEFFAAACALELFHKDGEWRFRKFIEEHPESNKAKWAYFYLGKSSFRKKKYEEVIKWLEQVEVYDLNREDLAELYFKRGYSYFETKNFTKAKADFYEIKDVDNKYARPANYYYSHIAYTENKYETAAEGFRRLLNDETFGPQVPFYISQIYFLQAKYDSVIKFAPSLLNDTSKILRREEISKIIGESFYRKKMYAQALPYLKTYGAVTQSDNYELGFALYNSGNKKEALPYFENSTTGSDTMAQSAWYHLADCQLAQGEKAKARNSFYSAYKTGPDENVREDALYSFAKLSYELSYTPYNEAINAFTEYINKYPNSHRKEEAYRYLVNVFASTQNYLEAMKAIQKINNAELSLKTIYQRMAWNYGIEWFNRNQNDSALRYFNVAIKNNFDPKVGALATYWTGEIKYRNKDYNAATEIFKQYQLMPGAIGTKEYDLANYNIGYCYFLQKDYTNANLSFRKFTPKAKDQDAEKIADALARIGDSYFMQKDYSGAADNYETAIALSQKDIDYCIYQKSICNGILQNYEEKINDLKMLAEKYPNSDYVKGCQIEIADAYIREKNYESAINFYNKYLAKYPNSAQENAIKAQIGVLYVNLKNNAKALEYFYVLVEKDSKSPESQSTAIPNIKNILLADGKTDEWISFCGKYGISVDKNEVEDALFEKAKNLFLVKQDCDASMPEFEKYINQFPNGGHLQEVNFWNSECAFAKNMFDKALPGYLFILKQKSNSFTEKSLLKASYIYFKNQNYEAALPLYLQLDSVAVDADNKFNSKVNAMRCAWYSKKYDVAAKEAGLVLASGKVKKEMELEAKKIRAHSDFEIGKTNEALEDFKYISKNAESIDGAEAYYYTGKIQLMDKKYKDVEKTTDKLMSYKYADKYWMTKGLIQMADCYTEQKKYSDAEALLNTIINNQVDESLKAEAQKKLDELKAIQTQKMLIEQPKTEPGTDIEFKNSNNKKDKDLFDEMYDNLQKDNQPKEENKKIEEPK